MYLGVITLTKLLLGFNQKIFSEKHLDNWTHDFSTFLTSVFITTVDLILHQYLEINLAFSVFNPLLGIGQVKTCPEISLNNFLGGPKSNLREIFAWCEPINLRFYLSEPCSNLCVCVFINYLWPNLEPVKICWPKEKSKHIIWHIENKRI